MLYFLAHILLPRVRCHKPACCFAADAAYVLLTDISNPEYNCLITVLNSTIMG